MLVETILSVGKFGSAVKSTYDAYQTASAIIKGKTRNEFALDEVVTQLKKMNHRVEKLSDKLFYAPDLEMVRNLSKQEQQDKLRNIREQLDPIQKIFDTDILSSSVIETPKKMRQALGENPWEVLINISPVKYAKEPNERGFIPISFQHDNIWYIGWQKKGALPSLFDCEYQDIEKIIKNEVCEQNLLATKQEKIEKTNQFIIYPNSTVKDTKTGLLWKQCTEGTLGVDCSEGKATKYKWNKAVKLSLRHEFAGYTDWRLPTIEELKSLVLCSNGISKIDISENTCCDEKFNKNYYRPTINQKIFPHTFPEKYWSSTILSNSQAELINFFNGRTESYSRDYFSFYTRLVRNAST